MNISDSTIAYKVLTNLQLKFIVKKSIGKLKPNEKGEIRVEFVDIDEDMIELGKFKIVVCPSLYDFVKVSELKKNWIMNVDRN